MAIFRTWALTYCITTTTFEKNMRLLNGVCGKIRPFSNITPTCSTWRSNWTRRRLTKVCVHEPTSKKCRWDFYMISEQYRRTPSVRFLPSTWCPRAKIRWYSISYTFRYKHRHPRKTWRSLHIMLQIASREWINSLSAQLKNLLAHILYNSLGRLYVLFEGSWLISKVLIGAVHS